MRASPTTPTAACCRCSARSSRASESHVFEHALTRRKAEQGVKLDTRALRRRPARALHRVQAALRRGLRRRSSRRIPASSCGSRSRPCSAPGARRERTSTAAPTTSPTTSAPPRTSARWCSATAARARAPGVCFSRDPATGEHVLYGEFLQNAQGEDVVAGIRTPEPIERMRELLPEAYDELVATVERLEQHHREVQDIEFTVEQGRLYMLQTRTAKRTAQAALRIVREFVAEGVITPDEAVLRIDPAQLDQLLHPAAGRIRRGASRSRAGWAPRPARRWAPPCSTPTPRPRAAPPARPSCSCAGRRRPTTSTA